MMLLSETSHILTLSSVLLETSKLPLVTSLKVDETVSSSYFSTSTPLQSPITSLLSSLDQVTSETPISLPLTSATPLVTETIFGFLNFVTTVRNTVMVFTQAGSGMSVVCLCQGSIRVDKHKILLSHRYLNLFLFR